MLVALAIIALLVAFSLALMVLSVEQKGTGYKALVTGMMDSRQGSSRFFNRITPRGFS